MFEPDDLQLFLWDLFIILSCFLAESCSVIPWPFNQLSLHMGKGNTFKVHLYFDSDVWGRYLTIILDLIYILGILDYVLDLFLILSFLPKLTVKWGESSQPKIGQ